MTRSPKRVPTRITRRLNPIRNRLMKKYGTRYLKPLNGKLNAMKFVYYNEVLGNPWVKEAEQEEMKDQIDTLSLEIEALEKAENDKK